MALLSIPKIDNQPVKVTFVLLAMAGYINLYIRVVVIYIPKQINYWFSHACYIMASSLQVLWILSFYLAISPKPLFTKVKTMKQGHAEGI